MSRIGSLNCRSFEDRIHQILDDRLTLTGDDLLMAHAARCADCEQILNDYDSVDDSVKLLPADLAEILREADAKRVSPAFASRRLVVLASLAAMIVISLNIFHGLNNEPPIQSASVAHVASAPLLAIATLEADNQRLPIATQPQRPTPDTSPFSKNFSVENSILSINLPTTLPAVPTWGDISKSLDPLEPVLTYSSKIPAVRPVHCSLNATINLLKQSFSKSDQKPDLGFWVDPNMLAAV